MRTLLLERAELLHERRTLENSLSGASAEERNEALDAWRAANRERLEMVREGLGLLGASSRRGA